jgi:hypothetical protein
MGICVPLAEQGVVIPFYFYFSNYIICFDGIKVQSYLYIFDCNFIVSVVLTINQNGTGRTKMHGPLGLRTQTDNLLGHPF